MADRYTHLLIKTHIDIENKIEFNSIEKQGNLLSE